jgi:two-component system, NtrC family, response regulator
MVKILIIDDEKLVYKSLAALTARMGCKTIWRQTLAQGLKEVEQEEYAAVLLDVCLPDGNGLEIISKIRLAPSQPEVIIMTGFGDKNGAEIAIKNGAWDYIQKTGSPHDVTLSLKRVLEYRQQKLKHVSTPLALNLKGTIGESKPMKACYDQLAQAAASDANVLLSGETGTGKEIFARAIHDNSKRSNDDLVVVDCAALPETLVESLLFGNEKGAFTGADKARDGLVGQANGGTLFLDEIGELPLTTQKVFLRVLQERCYRPVGGKKELPSNFRLIAATNRDLDGMAQSGQFRKDLLYRIRTISITLPPLRERADDIKLLALHYLLKFCERNSSGNKGVSPDFIDALNRYPWPGNVRELISSVEMAISDAGHAPTLFACNLPQYIRLHTIQSSLQTKPCSFDNDTKGQLKSVISPKKHTPFKEFRRGVVSTAEKEYFKNLVHTSGSSMEVAIRISGLSRARLYGILKQHNLSL